MHVDRNGERLQRGADDDDGRNRVEEAADDQENERDEEAGPDQSEMPCSDVLEQRLGDLEVGQQPAEYRRSSDAEQRDGSELAGFEKRRPQMVPVNLAEKKDRQ